MRVSEIHSGLVYIQFSGGAVIERDDFSAMLSCRGEYGRDGGYLGSRREFGNQQIWNVRGASRSGRMPLRDAVKAVAGSGRIVRAF